MLIANFEVRVYLDSEEDSVINSKCEEVSDVFYRAIDAIRTANPDVVISVVEV